MQSNGCRVQQTGMSPHVSEGACIRHKHGGILFRNQGPSLKVHLNHQTRVSLEGSHATTQASDKVCILVCSSSSSTCKLCENVYEVAHAACSTQVCIHVYVCVCMCARERVVGAVCVKCLRLRAMQPIRHAHYACEMRRGFM